MMRSASVRLHDADFAATKCCHSAAAMPATASSSANVPATRLPAGPRQTRPSTAKTPIATKIRRCSTHQGQGCIVERVLRDERGDDDAERRATATNANHGAFVAPPPRARPRARRRHSAAWAISSISTQAPSGSWATP